MRQRCLNCKGIGHLFSYKPVPMYDNKLTRFWRGICRSCNGSGYVTLTIDSKQNASGELQSNNDAVFVLS